MSVTNTASLEESIAEVLESLGGDVETLLEPRATMRREEGDARTAEAEGIINKLWALSKEPLRVEGTLGEGGMGVVQMATQAVLGRRVALKKLRGEHRTPQTTLKLLREAWVTGSLEHPNILPIYDVRFDDDGVPQIVLKRIKGVNWADVIDDEWAASERFGADSLLDHNLEVLMQVCQAVHFAHTRGVAHRDLKPNNVMIGDHGEVYLLDWGIAVNMLDVEDELHIARQGAEIAGTPGYMAPEMLRGEAVCQRTDVYLLGAMLHEILAGRPPHVGDTPEDVARSVILSEPPDPEGAPRGLCAIMRRAMRADRDERFPTAKAMRLALQEFLQHRVAIRLADEAERRLQSLIAIAEDAPSSRGDDKPAARRAEAYELYGGCRFGFRQALSSWPEYEAAQKGIERAVEAMAEVELHCGDPIAASDLLAELSGPRSTLVGRVADEERVQEEKRARIAKLEQLGEDLDTSRGARSRAMLVAGLGFAWTLAPLITAWTVDPRTESYPSMIVSPVFVGIGLAGITLVARRELSMTVLNRRVVYLIALGLAGQLAVALATEPMGISGMNGRMLMLVVWGLVAGMGTATVDKRLWWGALAFPVAFFICLALATTIAHVLYAMAATYFLISLNAVLIWRPAPDKSP